MGKGDRRPYQFSQGMIDPPDPLRTAPKQKSPRRRAPASRPPPKAGSAERWRSRAARRARSLAHRVVPGARRQAQLSLLQQVFERPVPWPCPGGHKSGIRSAAAADVLCFDNAHDANGNGRFDDINADLGVIVETGDSSLRFAYLSGQRVRIGVLTPGRPHTHRARGRIVNSYIRTKRRQDPRGTCYLAAELVSGYVTVKP